jgi:hypothetical protein
LILVWALRAADPSPAALGSEAPGPAPLRAEVTFADGTRAVYDEPAGEDLGDFRGPGFVQRCVRVTLPGSPLTVFFRPDRGGDRVEVVFELGRLWGEANAKAANLPGYRARVLRGEKVLAGVDVPRHWWFSRWRWQSAPRPVITRAATLIERGFLPAPFDPALVRLCRPAPRVRYAGPMDPAGVYLAMPTTGDRPDIGPFTEWQAEYLATGLTQARASVFAQAEASGSVPWHLRDERTGAPLDVYAHPTVHFNMPRVDKQYEHIEVTKTEWQIDDAHQPALAYVPYLLTGDPYYLEALQFQAAWGVGWTAYHRDVQKLAVANPGQTRSFAWTLRSVAQLARVTPAQTPRWLLPRAHWARLLADNLTYFTREWVKSPKAEQVVFRSATRPDMPQAFMEDYLAIVLGWLVTMGFEEWREAFAWKVGAEIARSDGRHGWPAQWCSPYMYAVRRPDGSPYRSWSEAWDAFRSDPRNKVPAAFPAWPRWAQNNSWGYTYYTLAALTIAQRLGVEGAGPAYRNVRTITLDGFRRGQGPMFYRWAFAGPGATPRAPARDAAAAGDRGRRTP